MLKKPLQHDQQECQVSHLAAAERKQQFLSGLLSKLCCHLEVRAHTPGHTIAIGFCISCKIAKSSTFHTLPCTGAVTGRVVPELVSPVASKLTLFLTSARISSALCRSYVVASKSLGACRQNACQVQFAELTVKMAPAF